MIPTVTTDDLLAFHGAHFGPIDQAAYHPVGQDTTSDLDGAQEWDTLGYYPDGVKRTLTDEQIAIFRHSETQTLLRERGQGNRQKMQEEKTHNVKEQIGVPESGKLSLGYSEIDEKPVVQEPGTDKSQMSEQSCGQRKSRRLDVDGDGLHEKPNAKMPDGLLFQVTGRRIISYADLKELQDEPCTDLRTPHNELGNCQFIWPKLGQ